MLTRDRSSVAYFVEEGCRGVRDVGKWAEDRIVKCEMIEKKACDMYGLSSREIRVG